MNRSPVHPPPARPVTPLEDAERWESLVDTLARQTDSGDLHIFAYGSLIWNPCFEVAVREPAVLDGYRRSFSIWTVHARGSPERPGLGLALVPCDGSRCNGVLFGLAPETGVSALLPLWEREMWTRAYHPKWVQVTSGRGSRTALTFVVSEDQPQYAGTMPDCVSARYIASATGKFGSCRDYLAQTVAALQEAGISDPELEALLRRVDRIRV